jgi:hypothetical protein
MITNKFGETAFLGQKVMLSKQNILSVTVIFHCQLLPYMLLLLSVPVPGTGMTQVPVTHIHGNGTGTYCFEN